MRNEQTGHPAQEHEDDSEHDMMDVQAAVNDVARPPAHLGADHAHGQTDEQKAADHPDEEPEERQSSGLTKIPEPSATHKATLYGQKVRKYVPRIFATLLAFIALLSALGALGGALGRGATRVHELLANVLLLTPLNLGYAAALAVLAGATARRKRVAFWIQVAYFSFLFVVVLLVFGIAISGVADEPFLGRGDIIGLALGALVSIAALNLLYWGRHEFYARVRKGGLRQAFAAFAAVVAIGVGLGYTLVSVFPGSLEGTPEKFRYCVDKVLGGFGFALDTQGQAPGWVNFILGIVRCGRGLRRRCSPCCARSRSPLSFPATTKRGSGDCWLATASRTRSATSPPAATRPSSSRPAARPPSPTGWSTGVSLASGDPIGDPEAWAAGHRGLAGRGPRATPGPRP